MSTLIEQLVSKLGLCEEPEVLGKTKELLRLLELRSSNAPLQINEYGKIVLCADLASNLLGIAFDNEEALKLSALRNSNYQNNKRMLTKLLDLNKLANINDICIQMGFSEVAPKAEELLSLFKSLASETTDKNHPQYAAMAVFYACRLLKKKFSKAKLIPLSNLRPSQWQQLEKQWDRMVAKHLKESYAKTGLKDKPILTSVITEKGKRNHLKPEIEGYEMWKSRILTQAKAKLNDELKEE